LRDTVMYVGSHAEATAVVIADGVAWVGNVGLGRCHRIDRTGLVQLTRDDSVLAHLRDAGEVGLDGSLGNILTAALGTWAASRPGWRPTLVSLDDANGFLLATQEAHRAATLDQLTSWSYEAISERSLDRSAAALWHRLRANVARSSTLIRAEFERRAAVMLLRVR
jgi:serine/threonine protein phosphatase PrpC